MKINGILFKVSQSMVSDFRTVPNPIQRSKVRHTRPGKTVTVCELENGPVEIVDLPSYKMVIVHSYVNVYQRVIPMKNQLFQSKNLFP